MSLQYLNVNDLKFTNSYTLTTIPHESRYLMNSSLGSINLSHNHFKNPYQETKPSKFPKGKRVIKTTKGNLYDQTTQNPERSSIKNFIHANRSIIQDAPQPRKRSRNPGFFHSHSLQSVPLIPKKGSFEDIGTDARRKNFLHLRKPDPIIIGQQISRVMNSTYEQNWKEPRRHRDNGVRTSQTLKWNTRKPKPKTYAEIHSTRKI